ncbi:MAG: N-formylglutamate amidohydrolase [Thalassobaculum sp.]|uniref:N-formylglutamate amidohydrolase n=1 Tax=Thalassobaculum sp. TaxID=2022740 RepID=UPI0032F018E3
MTLLTSDDPAPVRVENADRPAPILFVSDHDANAVPAALDRLGLPDEELGRHIGYDPGIARIARRLAARFEAPLIATGYSRLVVDCNRVPYTPGSIPAVSDGTAVPGNRDLDGAAMRARYDELFQPYHAAIAGHLDRAAAAGRSPLLVALHSFTPRLRVGGGDRPWPIGFLWGADDRATAPMIELFAARNPDVAVGANQPYSGATPGGYTVPVHAERRGLHNLTLEFRQDLVADPAGGDAWADRFGDALAELLDRGLPA